MPGSDDHDASPPSSQPEAEDRDRSERDRSATAVDFEHSVSLPILLERVGVSLVVSTYQAGKIFTVGVCGSKLVVRFHHVEQAMGITRTPTGLAIGTKRQIWPLADAENGWREGKRDSGRLIDTTTGAVHKARASARMRRHVGQ